MDCLELFSAEQRGGLGDEMGRNRVSGRALVALPYPEARIGLLLRAAKPRLRIALELLERARLLRRVGPEEEAAPLKLNLRGLLLKFSQPDRCDQTPGSEVI